VAVSVRVRPSEGAPSGIGVMPQNGGITCGTSTFGYPAHVLQGSDQAEAGAALLTDLMLKFIRGGTSCTLMAYGQTGSGKTYTMFGPPGGLTEASLEQAGGAVPETWGAFPRAMMQLLGVRELAGATFHASAVEVYMEQAYDLLDGRKPVKIGSAKGFGRGTLVESDMDKAPVYAGDVLIVGGVHPSGCSCFKCFQKTGGLVGKVKGSTMADMGAKKQAVPKLSKAVKKGGKSAVGVEKDFGTEGETKMELKSPVDVAKLARLVESERVAHGHALNERSSRSHCLVRVHCTHVEGGISKKRQFLFVDLAGSERISKSFVTGARAKEASNINQSLTTLGVVVKQLNDGSTHVSYRDSALTMLLRSSFGGPSCTGVVISVRGDTDHAEETTCSLRFGEKLASVKTSAVAAAATDVGAQWRVVNAKLQAARAWLDELTCAGKGDRIGTAADCIGLPRPPTSSEQETLRKNIATLAEREAEVRRLKVQVIEAKASQSDALHELEAELKGMMLSHSELEVIVEAQKTIKGLWVPGTHAFKRAEAQVAELTAEMQMLGIPS